VSAAATGGHSRHSGQGSNTDARGSGPLCTLYYSLITRINGFREFLSQSLARLVSARSDSPVPNCQQLVYSLSERPHSVLHLHCSSPSIAHVAVRSAGGGTAVYRLALSRRRRTEDGGEASASDEAACEVINVGPSDCVSTFEVSVRPMLLTISDPRAYFILTNHSGRHYRAFDG
jgi:hypothetical protein